MIIGKSNLASVFKAMPKQDDDIFEFNLASNNQDKINYEGINYMRVTLNTRDVVLVPTSMFANQKKEQVINHVNKLYYQYTLFEKYLTPEQIKQAANQLKNDDYILNYIARQATFDFQKLYEHQLKIHLEKTPEQLSSKLPKFIKILDDEGNLQSVKLSLDENKINQMIEQIKKDLVTTPGSEKIWEEATEEILTAHLESAVQKMEQDLGTEAFNNLLPNNILENLFPYFNGNKTMDVSTELRLVLPKIIRNIVKSLAKSRDLPDFTPSELDLILGTGQNIKDKLVPVTESRLTDTALPIPSFAAFKSAITAQLRQDLWNQDSNGFAYFKHQSKSNSKNYIEHYISSPGDIELLPLEQAEQIIDKFGFNTVKLHLIFAAHTMNQDRPWDSKFSLKASDVIKYLGWDKRTDLPVHQKLNEIAKTAFVLDCLLVKSVWIEGRNKKGGIDASTPTGRIWNVTVDPRGEQNLEGKIEKPKEVYITVQPGLIFYNFLNKAGSQLKQALYQFGYLAQDILRIDPYHDELALRLAIHLAMESRVHLSGKYRVETLLKHLLPHTVIDTARSDTRRGYDLKQRWDNALKLLKQLNWQIQFDESYPSWLQPGSKLKKPADARKMKIIEWLLQAKITIYPPQPIPELLAAKVKPKLPSSKQKKKKIAVTGITSDQIRKGRNAKGWSQRKLAGWLGVTQTLVGYWEKGKRTPSEAMEIKLRQILEIID
jgi:DNA-binding transcriptional regulator YiaG